MSICVDVGGKDVEFQNFTFDSSSLKFKSEINPDTGIALTIDTPLKLDLQFENKEFEVYFLAKKGLVESEIFQVIDKKREQRIGWCIPVNAFDSIEHNYADNPHFLRYAYVALKYGLNNLDENIFRNKPLIDEERPVQLSEVLPDNVSLLVISLETLDAKFEINKWIPSLASFGYFRLTAIDPVNICIERERIANSKINLISTSEEIKDLGHLNTIYSHAYPFEKNPLFQFFYLYQIIELVMELIFKNEQTCLVNKILSVQHDLNATKELLEGVNSNTSEKRRIRLMAREYSSCEGDLSELIDVSNELLVLLNQPPGTNLETTIYPIRNFLFHQFRNFPSGGDTVLLRLISCLSTLLPILLGNFKCPKP